MIAHWQMIGHHTTKDLYPTACRSGWIRISSGGIWSGFRSKEMEWNIEWRREPPLNVRRNKLFIQYSLKLSSYPQNPTYNTVFNSKFKVSFERKPHHIPPLGIRIQPDLRAVGFLRRNVLNCSIPATPWVFKRTHIDYSIHQSFKDNTSREIYRNKFFEFCDHYRDFSRLYTDGSRMRKQVATAVVYRSTTKTTRLPNTATIFSAELYAISLALTIICHCKDNNFVIFLDSTSSLQALSGFKKTWNNILSKTLSKIILILPTVVKRLFYAGYQAMSALWAVRGLTLQQNQLFHCPLQIWSFQQVNFFLRSPSSALTNGRWYGTVLMVMNSILFTPQLALWRIARISHATILYLSTDSALVILD